MNPHEYRSIASIARGDAPLGLNPTANANILTTKPSA